MAQFSLLVDLALYLRLLIPTGTNLAELQMLQGLVAHADVLLLPNTRTYFDLIALEAMALCIPILASCTGGNKKLSSLSSGVILVDSTDDGLSAVLKNFSSMDGGRRIEIGGNNSDAFIKYFTAPKFAEDYVNIIVNN